MESNFPRGKHGTIIHGFKVMGGTDWMAGAARELKAELAVISMARVPAASIRRIVGLADVYTDSGEPDDLLAKYGMTANDIVVAAREAVGEK